MDKVDTALLSIPVDAAGREDSLWVAYFIGVQPTILPAVPHFSAASSPPPKKWIRK
jgi:hypothetical protein